MSNPNTAISSHLPEAQFLGFMAHLDHLATVRKITPNLAAGTTQISIPAYFALEGHGHNPINLAALNLVPEYSRSNGSISHPTYNRSGLREAAALPREALVAARRGKAYDFLVAEQLGLLSNHVQRVLTNRSSTNARERAEMHCINYISEAVSSTPLELNQQAVDSVEAVADRCRSFGYQDFLDYLVDARQQINSEIDRLINDPPEALEP